MIRRSVLTFVLYLGLSITGAAEESEQAIELALDGIGTGSAEEIKERIKTTRYTYLDPQFRDQTVASLPDRIRNQRVMSGPALRRAEKALAQVLELYGRQGSVELILYRSESPHAAIWRGCVITISDSLAAKLLDEALLGIIAHELAHTYFMDESTPARRDGDVQSMKVVELKCDAFAYLTLKLLGRDAGYYMTGLRERERIEKAAGMWRKPAQRHPEVWERAQFLEQFARRLGR